MSSQKPQVLFLGDLNESLPEFAQFKEKFDVIVRSFPQFLAEK